MDSGALDACFGTAMIILSLFGGIALVIWTSVMAPVAKTRATYKLTHAARTANTPDQAILAELAALKRQLGDMQNTSHQFDIAFDEALHRLENRVDRMESLTVPRRVDPLTAEQRIGA